MGTTSDDAQATSRVQVLLRRGPLALLAFAVWVMALPVWAQDDPLEATGFQPARPHAHLALGRASTPTPGT
jgi:hypothetical protein